MSDPSSSLPTTLAECHAMITEMAAVNATLRATIDEQQALLQSLQRDMALMKRSLFGQRRERFEDPQQGMLFDSVAVGAPESEDASNQDDPLDSDTSHEGEENEGTGDKGPTTASRGGRGRRVITDSLPSVPRIHTLAEPESPAHQPGETRPPRLKKVGEDV